MNRKDAGFTLVEAMVAMAILVMVVTIAIPSLKSLAERQRAIATMNDLVVHMTHARMAAINHRHPTILCPSADGEACDPNGDWNNGWMLFIDRTRNRRPADANDILRVNLHPSTRPVRLLGTRARPYLRYMPDGRSAGSNLTIRLCDQQGNMLGSVIVNNAGRPRTERPNPPPACPH